MGDVGFVLRELINPAFDIVPKELITGIITENGIINPI